MGAVSVVVIGGYLGAGKTTLLNHLLATADRRLAVLVNDFGAINIDQDLIAAEDDEMITLANGCICCSLVEGFAAALDQVAQMDPPPDAVVIEASGVADPAQVGAYGHRPGLAPDATVVVVDAETIMAKADDVYVGDVVVGQLRTADLVVLNKVDLVDQATQAAVAEWLATAVPTASIIPAVQGQVDPAALLGFRGDPKPAPPAAPSDLHAGIFETWHFESAEPIEPADFDRFVAMLSPDVARVKGVIRLADGPDRRIVFHRVGTRAETLDDGPWLGGPSRLVAIAPRGRLDSVSLTSALTAQPRLRQ